MYYVMPLTVWRRYVTYTNCGAQWVFCSELVFHSKNLIVTSLSMPLLQLGHEIAKHNFQIIHRPKRTIIKIDESVVIHQQKPCFNNMESSNPLIMLYFFFYFQSGFSKYCFMVTCLLSIETVTSAITAMIQLDNQSAVFLRL